MVQLLQLHDSPKSTRKILCIFYSHAYSDNGIRQTTTSNFFTSDRSDRRVSSPPAEILECRIYERVAGEDALADLHIPLEIDRDFSVLWPFGNVLARDNAHP